MVQRRHFIYFSPVHWRTLHSIFFAVFLCCFSSCQNNKNKKTSPTEAKALQPPTSIIAKKPIPVLLDASATPQTIVVPAKPTTYKIHTQSGDIILPLLPPEKKAAGFFSHMQYYNIDNGLALDAISCCCIDHFGNLWFGTQGGGVSRYDGKSFTSFTTAQGLSNNSVLSILEDNAGNLWFGTHGGGVSRYDGKSFTSFTTEQGLSNNSVFSIVEDRKGNIWFGTHGGGVCRYDGKSFTTYKTEQGLSNNNVFSILEDKKGNLWFGTDGGGVCRYDGKSFTTYTTEEGLGDNSVASIIEDKKGNIWFGTDGGGVSSYNGKSFTTYTTEQGLSNNTVLSILEDKTGNIWFGTDGGGVSRYDGKSFISYTTEQGLSNNNVFSIIEDKTGNLWFGTHGGGVSRYDGKSFISYTPAQGLPDKTVLSIIEDKNGNLWFGTQRNGVSCYDGKSYTIYSTAQGLGNNSVLSILEDKTGNLWFGTDGVGVSCYNGKAFTTFTTAQGLGNNTVFSILQDKKGDLWFGTYGGVSRYDGKSFTTYTTEQGLGSNSILSIQEDKEGNLWFGTDGGGVSRYDGKSFTTYTTAQGLSNNSIFSIKEDKEGNLWFGTQGGGVSRYDGKSFINFTTEQGLPDDSIESIVLDKQGNIVIGTNFGIAVLKSFASNIGESTRNNIPAQNNKSNEELQNYTPVFKIYNSQTGYPVKNINGGSNNGALLCDSKGNIWAGTGSEKTALIRFDPSALNKNLNPPSVVIQNVKINEENICWYYLAQSFLNGKGTTSGDSSIVAQQEIMTYGKVLNAQEGDTILKKLSGIQFDGITPFYPLPQNLVLPYQYNHITFEFAAIEPSKPYLVNYQYILENYDNDWSPVSKKTSAIFGNINEGTYTFKLRAQSPDGVWSQPVTYTFKVLPPLYRTWWAYSLYAIAIFLLLIGIYRWRTASLRKKNEMLEETIKQRTLEVVKEKDEAEKQRAEAEKQKILVEEKNKSITDSINYAKRIQRALLQEEEYVSMHLPEHFILFKPKDIVSGDFYWGIEKEEFFYMAAVDCTGHGVPGGFMSMLGLAFLNELTAGAAILTPAEILDELRNKILKEFKQTGGEDETKDGMDISLVRINLKTKEIQWSGANNALYLVHNELKEITPDKQPIGYYPLMKPFSNHTVKVEKDSILYLISDGYADQFGGPNGKKFRYSELKEVLFSIRQKSLKEQKMILNETFEKWKGNLEQVDDVLIIGIRIQ